jgi:hypothetical protein
MDLWKYGPFQTIYKFITFFLVMIFWESFLDIDSLYYVILYTKSL